LEKGTEAKPHAHAQSSKVFIDMRRRFFVFIRNFKHSRTGIVNSLFFTMGPCKHGAERAEALLSPEPDITGKNE
jgi:hypothetical protein